MTVRLRVDLGRGSDKRVQRSAIAQGLGARRRAPARSLQVPGFDADGIKPVWGQREREPLLRGVEPARTSFHARLNSLSDQFVVAEREVVVRVARHEQTHDFARHFSGLGVHVSRRRNAVGFKHIVRAPRVHPGLGATQETQILKQGVEQLGLGTRELQIRPGDHNRIVFGNPCKGIEHQCALVALAGHVVPSVGVDCDLRQAEGGRFDSASRASSA